MNKQYKKAVKQVAKEALDVIITTRMEEAEEKRRKQVRLNRGHDATWDEAKYASDFEDAVFKEIKKMGVDYEGDLIVREQLRVNRVVATRAHDHAFTWATRVAQEEAAAQHDARSEAYEESLKGLGKKKSDFVQTVIEEAIYVVDYFNDLTIDDAVGLALTFYHKGWDDKCVDLAVDAIRERVESRQREHYARELDDQVADEVKQLELEARAEKIVHEATKGTMTLAEFKEYVSRGDFKRDVDEALAMCGIVLGEPDLGNNEADTDYEEHVKNNPSLADVELTAEGGDAQFEDEVGTLTIHVYPSNVTVDERYNKIVADTVEEKIKRASKK